MIQTTTTQSLRPLNILLLSPTFGSDIKGADRDWINLANAFPPSEINLTWAGVEGCEGLRPNLTSSVVGQLVDLQFPPFTYLIQENAYRRRTAWLWAKILVDHVLRLSGPLREVCRMLRDLPLDLVVTNTAAITFGPAIAWLRRVPHVWCVKECLDPKVPACRWLVQWIRHTSAAVVAPCRAVASSFPGKVHVFPDGNDVQLIQSASQKKPRAEILRSLDLPFDRLVVAQVGGLCWWKGQRVTAEAIVRLSSRGGPPPFSLIFLGGGPPSYREELKGILAGMPAAWRNAVRWVQFDLDDFSYLAATDIVVHPSVLPDPFPNAVREAMILGKAVVASAEGGIPEMIDDGVTGLLVPPRNAEALASALTRVLGTPELRVRLGDAACRFGRRYFDIEYRKQAFLALFQALAHGGRVRSHTRAASTGC